MFDADPCKIANAIFHFIWMIFPLYVEYNCKVCLAVSSARLKLYSNILRKYIIYNIHIYIYIYLSGILNMANWCLKVMMLEFRFLPKSTY